LTIQGVLYRADKRGQLEASELVFRAAGITERPRPNRSGERRPAAEVAHSCCCVTRWYHNPSEGLAPQQTPQVFRLPPQAGKERSYGMRILARTLPQRMLTRDARDGLEGETGRLARFRLELNPPHFRDPAEAVLVDPLPLSKPVRC
jgi:hypothetical protein